MSASEGVGRLRPGSNKAWNEFPSDASWRSSCGWIRSARALLATRAWPSNGSPRPRFDGGGPAHGSGSSPVAFVAFKLGPFLGGIVGGQVAQWLGAPEQRRQE